MYSRLNCTIRPQSTKTFMRRHKFVRLRREIDFDLEESIGAVGTQNTETKDPRIDKMINTYSRKIDANRELFSAAAEKDYKTTFEKADSNETRQQWLSDLDGVIEELQKLHGDLERLAPEEMGNFANLRRHEKKNFIKQLINTGAGLEKDFSAKLYKSKNSKHFCKEEKDTAMKAFNGAPVAKQREMVKAVESWLEFEEQRSVEFEQLAKNLAKKDPYKKQLIETIRIEFYNKPYKEKLSIIMELKEALGLAIAQEEETIGQTEKYDALIAQKVQERVISASTSFKFRLWFKHQSIDGKKDATANFSDEMRPRMALMKRFQQEIDPRLQREEEANQEYGFYSLGHSGRTLRFDTLLKKQQEKNGTAADGGTGTKRQNGINESKLHALAKEVSNNGKITSRRRRHSIARAILSAKRHAEQRAILSAKRRAKQRPFQKRRSVITARDVARQQVIQEGDTIDIGGVWRIAWQPGDSEVRYGMKEIGKRLQTNQHLRESVDVEMKDLSGNDGMRYEAADLLIKQEEKRTRDMIAAGVMAETKQRGIIKADKPDRDLQKTVRDITAQTKLEVDLTQ